MNENRNTLILGLGNTLLTDDGIGVYASRRAKELHESRDFPADVNVSFEESEVAGFDLLEVLNGYDTAVIIDALLSNDGNPGEISVHSLDDFAPSQRLAGMHDVDLPTSIRLGNELGYDLPTTIRVICVKINAANVFATQCSPEIEPSIEEAAVRALSLVSS